MIAEHESVVLTADLPDHGLRAGDVGVVVMVHEDRGYEVEFLTLGGDTLAVVSLDPSHVRRVGRNEIAHVRPIRAA